jgi:hypothetical protein
MALMFDVRPTCIYTLQFVIADRGNVIKVVKRKKKSCPN